MNKKWDRPAMRFKSAGYVSRQGMLDVTFQNGDRFLVAVESVLPTVDSGHFRRNGVRVAGRTAPRTPNWLKVRIGPTGDVLEVPAVGTVIEIPWDRIRSLADPDFRAHLTAQAVRRARRIGTRLRAMRLQAGLTRGALAVKAGVAPTVVADLEAGKREPKIELLASIAVAMGRRLRDFAEVEA